VYYFCAGGAARVHSPIKGIESFETGFRTVMLLDRGVEYEPEGRSKATVREGKKGKEKKKRELLQAPLSLIL